MLVLILFRQLWGHRVWHVLRRVNCGRQFQLCFSRWIYFKYVTNEINVFDVNSWGPFFQIWKNGSPPWVINYINSKVWDLISYPFPNCSRNGVYIRRWTVSSYRLELLYIFLALEIHFKISSARYPPFLDLSVWTHLLLAVYMMSQSSHNNPQRDITIRKRTLH